MPLCHYPTVIGPASFFRETIIGWGGEGGGIGYWVFEIWAGCSIFSPGLSCLWLGHLPAAFDLNGGSSLATVASGGVGTRR